MSSDNILIRASAGSGKTFQLSNRYLSLAFGGAAWETMLASTFTKKAAGEILDRILLRLADAALHEKSRLDLAGFLKRPNDLSRQEVLDLLLQSVRNLHRLRVGTLDSFFIQIASSFCLELGIPLGWQIAEELDEQRFLAEAVREVFQQTDKADAVRLMHLLSKGEVARSISEEAFSLSKKLIQLYRDSPKDAWEKLPKHSSLSSEELEQAIELYANAELPKHKTIEKQRITDIDRIHNGDWASFFSSGPAKIIVTKKEYVYCTKNIEGDYKEALDKIIKHAKTELINKLAIQTEATGELLGRVLEQYERIKEENRALRFDDITFKLSCARLQDRLEQIVHRIDSPIHHLLLDEFQDTSPLQWDVLRPFVFAAIASAKRSDGSFFCVGDEKQAIYGWRGGVAAIFSTIEKEITPLRIEPLQKSYRSSQPVIDTVNAVFRDLPHNAVLAEHPDYLDAAKHWRFNNHETDKKELSGYCTLEVAPLYDPDKVEESFWDDTEEDEESGEAESKQAHTTLNFAIRRIAGLHRETPQATLGVLVRTNDPVGWIIRGLKKLGIDASEEGGNPLTDSP
ncbi:MAG: UvrD-helicase domain-containing protein, partial [Planctomycetaceae bacterium]|nr:UvrD-helicase domain-containing protein [Planctomycetaceae bacterium]